MGENVGAAFDGGPGAWAVRGVREHELIAAMTDLDGRARTGRLAPGLAADVVVLDGDPALDVRAFAKVRTTMRGGRIIYRKPP